MSLVDKSPPWDVYVVGREGRERCGKGEKSYLMERDRGGGGGGGGGLVPIDCFYRLMSGEFDEFFWQGNWRVLKFWHKNWRAKIFC